MAEVNGTYKSRKKKKFVGFDTFMTFFIIIALPAAVVYFSNQAINGSQSEVHLSLKEKQEKIVNSFANSQEYTIPKEVVSDVHINEYEKLNVGDFSIALSAPYVQNGYTNRDLRERYICSHVFFKSHADRNTTINASDFKAMFNNDSNVYAVFFRTLDTHYLAPSRVGRILNVKAMSMGAYSEGIEEICLAQASHKDNSQYKDNSQQESNDNMILPKKTRWQFSHEGKEYYWDMNDDPKLNSTRY